MLTVMIAFMACGGYITTDTQKRGKDVLMPKQNEKLKEKQLTFKR